MRRISLSIAIFIFMGALIICSSLADISYTLSPVQNGIDNTDKGTCVSLVDYNGDDNLDIYVGNNGIFPEPMGKPNRLYLNNGDGTFTDVASEAGIADDLQAQGVAFGDFDNDGDPDLYVANDFGINTIYFNNGDGTFADMTGNAGAVGGIDIVGGDEIANGYGVALADENSDGYLDIYVVNLGSGNILYRNNGDGTFSDITEQSGTKAGAGPQGAGTAAVFGDCNGDGRVDLYAANGYGLPGFLYINTGDGFQDETEVAGVGENGDAQGVIMGDYDNDGDLDLYISNYADAQGAPLQNILYRNNGKGIFDDVTEEAGLVGENYSLGAAFGDLDNDGHLDLYIINDADPNTLFKNNGDGTFTDVTEDAGVGDMGMGSNAALGDLNNDGYLDIYVANGGFSDEDIGDPDVLYINNGGVNHWLQVELRGTASNSMGIGAQIILSACGLRQLREVSGGRGYSQDSSIANFGLGDNATVEKIEVIWPSGVVQLVNGIESDQRIVIEEGTSALVKPSGSQILTWGEIKRIKPMAQDTNMSPGLGQSYPNPCNPEVWIPYQLAQGSSVYISIFNSSGQLVRKLDIGFRASGVYSSQHRAAHWDGRNTAGENVPSGIYFYSIRAANFAAIKKMLLVR